MNKEHEYMIDPQGRPRFYGIYRGEVVSSKDPLHKYRVKVTVHIATGVETTAWAEACFPITTTRYVYSEEDLPKKGKHVWVMFEAGDPEFPVWIGTHII